MPVEVEVYKFDIRGDLKRIGEGKLPDVPSHINMSNPKGRIDFGGKDNSVVKVNVLGYPVLNGFLMENRKSVFVLPLMIGRIPQPEVLMYAIFMILKPQSYIKNYYLS